MWILVIFASLGLVFLLYAFAQFSRQGATATKSHSDKTNSPRSKAKRAEVLNIRVESSRNTDSRPASRVEWSHGNGEIQFRRIDGDGVRLRRIRARAKPG